MQENFICSGNLEVQLEAPGFYTLTASDFIEDPEENYPDTEFSFSSDPDDDTVLLDCLDLGTQTVTIWGIEEGGNQSQCTSLLTVVDDDNHCSNNDCTATEYNLVGLFGPHYYRASDYIVASGTVDQSVFFQATNEITLLPGFSAQVGTTFKAQIDPCTPAARRPPGISVENTKQEAAVQVFPNPFTQHSQIRIFLPEGGPLKTLLLDANGLIIRELVNSVAYEDTYWESTFDDLDLATGMYFLQVAAGKWQKIIKLVRVSP